MFQVARIPLLLFTGWLAACTATSNTASPQAGASPAPPAAPGAFEKVGSFAPSNYEALAVWPEEYAGPLLVLDAQPQGALVAKGDVIATLDMHPMQKALHAAELETQSATIRHQGVVEQQSIEADEARAQLALTQAALSRAQRELEGWKKFELAFVNRHHELEKRYDQANEEDAVDELDQLRKMYAADALVDATEDIVVKRSERGLELSKLGHQLSHDRRVYSETVELQLEREKREEAVLTQADALERLHLKQAIAARARLDSMRRSEDALAQQTETLARLRRDSERLVLRAPRAGVLLHGDVEHYRPGQTPPRHERGSTLAPRQNLFLIADPEPSQVALELGDADRAKLGKSDAVSVQLLGDANARHTGKLRPDAYPRAISPTEALYPATVTLDAPPKGAVYGACVKVTAAGAKEASE